VSPVVTTRGCAARVTLSRPDAASGIVTTATPTMRGGITAQPTGSDALRWPVAKTPMPKESAANAASQLAARLDRLAPVLERGWTGRADIGSLTILRVLRGVEQRHVLEFSALRGSDARRLSELAASLAASYGAGPAKLRAKDRETVLHGPLGLLDAVLEQGRKGVEVTRYKGLGEMNPDQLWETTLDPNARSLLQVKVAHTEVAEEVFSTLMGDVVEPRREFIQANALKVSKLDV